MALAPVPVPSPLPTPEARIQFDYLTVVLLPVLALVQLLAPLHFPPCHLRTDERLLRVPTTHVSPNVSFRSTHTPL